MQEIQKLKKTPAKKPFAIGKPPDLGRLMRQWTRHVLKTQRLQRGLIRKEKLLQLQ
jgi:hypothetical protein